MLCHSVCCLDESECWKEELLALARSKQERTESELLCLRQVFPTCILIFDHVWFPVAPPQHPLTFFTITVSYQFLKMSLPSPFYLLLSHHLVFQHSLSNSSISPQEAELATSLISSHVWSNIKALYRIQKTFWEIMAIYDVQLKLIHYRNH